MTTASRLFRKVPSGTPGASDAEDSDSDSDTSDGDRNERLRNLGLE